MKKQFDLEALKAIEDVSENELEQLFAGNGDGAIWSISHECHMNSFQFLFTCCK